MKKLHFVLFIGLLSVFIVISCNKNTPVEPESDPNTDYQTIEGNHGTIGKAGGKLTINDPNNPMNGTYVEIPSGALSQKKDIKFDLATGNDKNEEDSTAIMIKFEPSGLTFEKPIKIGLPLADYNTSNKVYAFYYYPNKNYVKQFPIAAFNYSTKVATIETDHFSTYYSTVDASGLASFSTATMGIEMLDIDGSIGARITSLGSGGNSGLKYIYSPTDYFAYQSLINGTSKNAYLYFDLFRVRTAWQDEYLDTKIFYIKKMIDNGNQWTLKITDDNGNEYYSTKVLNSESNLNNWFSGMTLLCKFDANLENGEEYYVEITWYLSQYNAPAIWSTSEKIRYKVILEQGIKRVYSGV